jgi:hypothetical protein
MRGRLYATGGVLPERDLHELTDHLACRIYGRFGQRAYFLSRQDVIELITPYIADLAHEDQRALSWLVWDLLQEGMEMEFA